MDVKEVTIRILEEEKIFGWKVHVLNGITGGIAARNSRGKDLILGHDSPLELICHEVAHTKHWGHGEDHEQYQEILYKKWKDKIDIS